MSSRRNFIRQAIAVSAGFAGLARFTSSPASASVEPALNEESWLQFPREFSVRLISRRGEKMSDGFYVPGKADGMAAFSHKDKVFLIRNHENGVKSISDGAFGPNLELLGKLSREKFYEYGFGKRPGLGGTTTVVFDEERQTVEEQFLSLAGTNRNCAGGPTPWNSWISCEEDVTPAGETSEVAHGYNFEVPVNHRGVVVPVPLKSMGRFNHEAVCVDPATGIVYQTEDRYDSLIYRFIPDQREHLSNGGVLQALSLRTGSGFDTRNWLNNEMVVGETYEVDWITLDHVDSGQDDLRLRGHAKGAAVFARGEGMWFGRHEVYFACTNGGARKAGQVFRYIPSVKEGTSDEKNYPAHLTLFAEPNNTDVLKYCDNLTVSPWGDVVLVEDSPDSCIRGITPEGKIYTIARNIGSHSELSGICFSPSGKTLFVNIQEQGLTYAVTGPWYKLRPGS